MENEEDYVRVVPATSGNNGGNKIKLSTGIESDRRCKGEGERERGWDTRYSYSRKKRREESESRMDEGES